MSEWQKIETAPRDGTDIIVQRSKHISDHIPEVGIDYWSKRLGNVWARSNSESQPILWQPLPKPRAKIDALKRGEE
jgi:hypothetical protein